MVNDRLGDIHAIYRNWLDGILSQEDALFEIGDILARAGAPPLVKAEVPTAAAPSETATLS